MSSKQDTCTPQRTTPQAHTHTHTPNAESLTEADVLCEVFQEVGAFFSLVPAGGAGAPGGHAGRGVVHIVGRDGAACRHRHQARLNVKCQRYPISDIYSL